MPTAVIAIDGGGGAGKSTLAHRLSDALRAPVIPTDDFASWDKPIDWWPRLIEQVLEPLRRGEPARWQRYDWEQRRLGGWAELPPHPPRVILEGVSAMRSEFEPYLTYRIWVETPAGLRLQRGLERDGEAMRDQWLRWMAAEDHYRAHDNPVARADAVVSGVS